MPIKPTPTALRIVQGNPGKRALPKNEPKPPPSRPPAPAFLSEEARAEWERIVGRLADVGLMTDIDVGVLAAYCDAYGTWQQARTALDRIAAADASSRGLVIRTTKGNLIQNPLVGTINTAMQLMHKFAAEFGMTPSARTRLDVDVGSAAPSNPQAPTGTDRFF